jgi:FAD/FMN-containing dehydrogenase
MTIQDLHQRLDGMGLVLETMGGSSGQTLAGAISTGTHGGDIFMGPLADCVLAIHLVGAGGTQ